MLHTCISSFHMIITPLLDTPYNQHAIVIENYIQWNPPKLLLIIILCIDPVFSFMFTQEYLHHSISLHFKWSAKMNEIKPSRRSYPLLSLEAEVLFKATVLLPPCIVIVSLRKTLSLNLRTSRVGYVLWLCGHTGMDK